MRDEYPSYFPIIYVSHSSHLNTTSLRVRFLTYLQLMPVLQNPNYYWPTI